MGNSTGETKKMKTLKGWITTTFLAVSLMASTTGANAGIIIAGATDTCTEPTKVESKQTSNSFSGILIAGLTGILIAGFGGIIIAGAADESQTNCGIIIAG